MLLYCHCFYQLSGIKLACIRECVVHLKLPLVTTLLHADPVLVRAPQRLRGVMTLLGVEVASGMDKSN